MKNNSLEKYSILFHPLTTTLLTKDLLFTFSPFTHSYFPFYSFNTLVRTPNSMQTSIFISILSCVVFAVALPTDTNKPLDSGDECHNLGTHDF